MGLPNKRRRAAATARMYKKIKSHSQAAPSDAAEFVEKARSGSLLCRKCGKPLSTIFVGVRYYFNMAVK